VSTYPGTAQIFRVPSIISGTGKATNFKFCTHIYKLNRNKRPFKISGEAAVSVGLLRDSRNFSGHTYRAHRAVIFAIAQISCSSVDCRTVGGYTRYKPLITILILSFLSYLVLGGRHNLTLMRHKFLVLAVKSG